MTEQETVSDERLDWLARHGRNGLILEEEIRAIAEEALLARRATPAPVVTVKPLEWHKSSMPSWSDDWHTIGPFAYTIRCADENGWKWSGGNGHGYELSAASAKAAAQADYERRIMAALSTPSTGQPAEGTEVTPDSDGDMLQRLGCDAALWAAEFRQTALRLGYSDMDEGWLIGWFANAIEQAAARHPDVRRLRDQIDPLTRERDVARALADRLRFEAQGHAQEARTANSTIYEIYQVISGGKGEPGNWNGAEPVRSYVADAEAEVARLRRVTEDLIEWLADAESLYIPGSTPDIEWRAEAEKRLTRARAVLPTQRGGVDEGDDDA